MNDEGPILGPGWLHAVSFLLLILGWVVGFNVLRENPRAAAAILAGSTLPAAIVVTQVIRLRRAIGVPTLEMKDELVPLGWSGNVTYVRPLRGATLRSIEARLECEEHVSKGNGRNKRDWREVVLDEPLSPQPSPMLEELRVTIPIRIPAAGPPSFEYVESEIVWRVRLRLLMDGCPNTRSAFRIRVAPAAVGK